MPAVAARAVPEGEDGPPFAVDGGAHRPGLGGDLDGVHAGEHRPRPGSPRPGVVHSPTSAERHASGPDHGVPRDGLRAAQHDPVAVGRGARLRRARRTLERIHAPASPTSSSWPARTPRPRWPCSGGIRGDARTRGVSVGVVRRSVTLDEETQLRRAGANVVFGGQVVPYLWDAWIEELLHVPRRRDARVPVSIAVWSHTAPGSDPGRGTSLNISVKGMLLETAEPLDVGSKLDLTFTLPGDRGAGARGGPGGARGRARTDGGPPAWASSS